MNLVQKEKEFEPNSLIVDSKIALLTKGIKLKAGQGVLKRGTVVSLEPNGLGVKTDKLNLDNIICGILTDDIEVDNTKDTIATIYITGHFNSENLIFKDGTILSDYERELRQLGIFCSKTK